MRRQLVLGLVILAQACSGATASTSSATQSPRPRASEGSNDGPKPYAEVITDSAVSDAGVFVVHRIDEDYYFEIPDSMLGRDMLLISRIAGVPAGMGGFLPAGVARGRQLVRWERVGDRVLLRRHETGAVADDSLPIYQSVVSNNFAPIIGSFDIEARTDADDASVIDIKDFFEGDTPSLSGLTVAQRRTFEVRRLDGSRSFIEYMRSFPLNVNVRHTLTTTGHARRKKTTHPRVARGAGWRSVDFSG